MPDDRPKRAATHGDRNENRRRTPAAGYPTYIDPEVTPPPQMPPMPPMQDASIVEIRAQLDVLAESLGSVTEAIGKVWDSRKDGDRFETIDEKLGAIAVMLTRHQTILDDNLIPQLDRWRATTDAIAVQLPKLAAALEGLTLMVNAIDHRQRNLENEVRTEKVRTEGVIAGIGVQIAAISTTISDHGKRVTALELVGRDQRVARRAISKRDKWLLAAGATAVSVLTFIAARWQWIASHF